MKFKFGFVVCMASALMTSGCVEVEGEIQGGQLGLPGTNTAAAGSGVTTPGIPTYPGSPSSPGTPTTPVIAPPRATGTIYTHNERYLYTYDLATNTETLVGRFSPPGGGMMGNMSDIAVSNNGTLIGISCFGVIYQINPVNAEITLLMQYPGGGNALTFLANGTLMAAGGRRITTVDLARQTITPLSQDQSFESSGDIAALPDGLLYETVLDGASDALVKIDPSNGHTVRIGSIGFKDVGGLAYVGGRLYGFNLSGSIILIDPATGRGTAIGSSSLDHFGAASNSQAW